jgi:hypothetical protein
MKIILAFSMFFITLLMISPIAHAQELNCQVAVSSQKVQTANHTIFQTLQTSVYEFMNNRRWTNYTYRVEERIECSILINVTDWNGSDEFKATIQVQSRRPIFNTSYNSVLINYMDKDCDFNYIENEPLDFQITTHSSNLMSTLAYYAYIIIGLDHDSYSMMGGTQFFEKAQTIVSNAQSAKEKGWKAYESMRNRYWMVENLMNASNSGMREASYQFHRLGLDMMYDKIDVGRAAITTSLETIRKVNREKPGLFLMNLFMSTKVDELVNIFSQAPPNEKAKAVNILKEIDPSNANKYDKIMQG